MKFFEDGTSTVQYLMHKNHKVLECLFSEAYQISEILDVADEDRVPVGAKKSGEVSLRLLSQWFNGRSIPASRPHIETHLMYMNLRTRTDLIQKCLGLSLSDHYWFMPSNMEPRWEDVNFFDNGFSDDVGDILIGGYPSPDMEMDYRSPDGTADGMMPKRWKIIDGRRFLMKGGTGGWQQQPVNEEIACAIMSRLKINHVPYHVINVNDRDYYSLCENFVTKETEFISAMLVRTFDDTAVSLYDDLIKSCAALNIPDPVDSVNKMIALDYIIQNEDRHWGNFGFIRNPDTLKWLGFAPIFDSGTSLWHDTPFVGEDRPSKTFERCHEKQLELVTDFSWFDPDSLVGLDREMEGVFRQTRRMEPSRAKQITDAVAARIKKLEDFAGREY